MIKTVPMTKILVFGLKDRLERMTAALAAANLVHLEKVDKLPEFAAAFGPAKNEALERKYRELEDKVAAAQSAFGAVPAAGLEIGDLALDLDKEAVQMAPLVEEVFTAAEKQTNHRKDLLEEEKKLSHMSNLMELLRGLDVDLKVLQHLKTMSVTLGMVGQDKLGLLKEGLKERFILVDRKVRPGEYLVVIVADKDDQALLEKVLSGAFFEELVLPDEFLGNPAQMAKKIHDRVRAIESEKQAIAEALADLKKRHASLLAVVEKKLRSAQLHFFAREHYRSSKEAALAAGWIPKQQLGELKSFLAAQPDGKDVMIVEDAAGTSAASQPPTKLAHGWLIRPFENILKIYGLPNYRELDPTGYTAIGFIVMFGMMFGDIGHGLFLGTIGALLRWGKKAKKTPALKDVGFLLLACGGVSTLFGFLYGSIFGFEHVVPHLWYNPFEELNFGLIVAIAWGVAFILGGALINVANRVANKQYIEAGLGRTGLAGIWFYLGSVALLAGVLAGIAPLKTGWALVFLCLLPMALIGLKEPLEAWHHNRHRAHGSHGEGRAKTGLLEIIILSVMEIYDTILSYLSNTLSFMRVAAFALNHVALLLAVFAIAQIIRDSTGSGIFYWAMVGIGNLAVIGLEGMIVTIQTLRLIYYEGFSKFFSGDGVAYQPFSVSSSVKP